MLMWIRRRLLKHQLPPEIVQAQRLIRAIDRGGIPLNPAKVNAIAVNGDSKLIQIFVGQRFKTDTPRTLHLR
ncbi:hypothetical protein [Propionivibrio limicola]|uniref:hypothetical protein n=1 Tax=Propionivibrio limicola TaxID=167645 RepID=UPI001291E7A1|nr:hypothetical protein [Propionivibrio limicola]